ncbi:hypothetical protein CM318V1_210101 [Carnobacterium maltaromaticum]|uniref:hypothetical protein n=1 Tax=Carnobacterium maltaromaticum TaxID=2751 RepID=UPI0007054935|nr:hypothetical protein [Carnobacterium maltaromaticum]KRN72379.1 hypothetical protein IV76_GL002605 [Carnobacterium maltaromaticum]CRH18082.1 hypothetical protein CM318V1_210101 [Carnobacterium maltaromaticum]
MKEIFLILFPLLVGYLINSKLERDKSMNDKKREIYEDFLNSITLILFDGGLDYVESPNESKLDMTSGYEKIKLWGSEEVIIAVYDLFAKQIEIQNNPGSLTQEQMKEPYYRMIMEMRRDLGKKDKFNLDETNIQIVKL